jgi:YtkA-like
MKIRRQLLVLALAWLVPAAAIACEVPSGFNVRGRIESGGVVVLFRTVPVAIEIGQHFSVEAVVCVAPPAPPANGLRVDAQMPEHRHGMNYRPRVTAKGDGVYVAEGFLFHMPGHWQLLFDVDLGGRTERLEVDMDLE